MSNLTEQNDGVIIFEMANYVKPKIEEIQGQDWVFNGPLNSFGKYILERYNGSPTTAAIIDAYTD